jgi:hypothetical protein
MEFIMGIRKKKNKLPPFVALPWELLNSEAYRDLPPSTGKALPYFLGKIKLSWNDPQRYAVVFDLTYDEANRYGFSGGTYSNIIKNLVSFGFIDPVDKGGLRGAGRSNNYFKLSRRWMKYNSRDFEPMDWKQFVPNVRKNSTSISETYSSNNRNKSVSGNTFISNIEAVGR